jgi:predicted glycosyl hydrolase (DUF1957 family)
MKMLWKNYKNVVDDGLPAGFYLKDFNFDRTLDKFLCENGVRESLTDTVIWENYQRLFLRQALFGDV